MYNVYVINHSYVGLYDAKRNDMYSCVLLPDQFRFHLFIERLHSYTLNIARTHDYGVQISISRQVGLPQDFARPRAE